MPRRAHTIPEIQEDVQVGASTTSDRMIPLSRPSCLRCVKRLITPSEYRHVCVPTECRKCEYCAKQRKACVPIPEKFNVMVNDLFDMQDRVIRNAAIIKPVGRQIYRMLLRGLVSRAKRIKKDVERWARKPKRHGGLPRTPGTMDENRQDLVAQSVAEVAQLERIAVALEALVEMVGKVGGRPGNGTSLVL